MANNELEEYNIAPDPELEEALAPPLSLQTTWIDSVASLAHHTSPSAETRTRTMINCDIVAGERSIYIPPDMAELQPDSQRYLHAFAEAHSLQLIEDKRRVTVQPIVEKRNQDSPLIAKALGELLRQLGLPGDIRPQSRPHRLDPDSEHIDIDNLIQMAAFAAPEAKQVSIQANHHLTDLLGDDNQTILAYGSRLMSADINTILTHFVSPEFRVIGYSTGHQYVLHVCLAGGSISNPQIWADFKTLTRTDFRFQLFSAAEIQNDFGLFYATHYLDLAESPAPWWLKRRSKNQREPESEPTMLKRAS